MSFTMLSATATATPEDDVLATVLGFGVLLLMLIMGIYVSQAVATRSQKIAGWSSIWLLGIVVLLGSSIGGSLWFWLAATLSLATALYAALPPPLLKLLLDKLSLWYLAAVTLMVRSPR